ncbi:MAG: hypothetical protein RLZZ618_2995, partial [Pseudomonadota bacterium]
MVEASGPSGTLRDDRDGGAPAQ